MIAIGYRLLSTTVYVQIHCVYMCGSGDKVVCRSRLGQPVTPVVLVFYLFLFTFPQGASPRVYHKSQKHKHKKSPRVYHKSQKHKHKEKNRTDELLLPNFPQGASPLVLKSHKHKQTKRNRTYEKCTSGVSETWWQELRAKGTMLYPGLICDTHVKESK